MRYRHFRANARASLYLGYGGIAARVCFNFIFQQSNKIKVRAFNGPKTRSKKMITYIKLCLHN